MKITRKIDLKNVFFKSYHHKTISQNELCCPKCKNRGTLDLIFTQLYQQKLFGKVASFKETSLVCSHCKTEIPKKEWSEDLKKLSKQELKKLKTPKELNSAYRRLTKIVFSAILFFVLFLVYQVKFNGATNKYSKENNESLKTVQANDIYYASFFKTQENGSYGLVKVVATNAEETVIQEYSKRYKDYSDGRSIDLSDIDQSQFASPKITVQTENLIKSQVLFETNKPYKDAAFGKVINKIEQ